MMKVKRVDMTRVVLFLSVLCGSIGAMDSSTAKRNASLLVRIEQDNLRQLQAELEMVRKKVDLDSSKYIDETSAPETLEKGERLAQLKRMVDADNEKIRSVSAEIERKKNYLAQRQQPQNSNNQLLVASIEYDGSVMLHDCQPEQKIEGVKNTDVDMHQTKKSKRKQCLII